MTSVARGCLNGSEAYDFKSRLLIPLHVRTRSSWWHTLWHLIRHCPSIITAMSNGFHAFPVTRRIIPRERERVSCDTNTLIIQYIVNYIWLKKSERYNKEKLRKDKGLVVEGHEPGKQRRFLIQARKLYEACHLSCQLSGVSGYDILTCYGSKLHHVGYPKFVIAAGDGHKIWQKLL